MTPKILVFAGSTREGSYNKRLAKAVRNAIENNNAEATLIDLKDYPMPLYDGDLEKSNGLPEMAAKFKQQLEDHDSFFVVSPEYNGFFPAVLKNVIDWATRNKEGQGSLESFANKVAAVSAASPGAIGGLRTLFSIRQLLTNIKVLVIPDQVAVGNAADVISEDGEISDEKIKKQLDTIANKLVTTTKKLHSA